MTYRLVYGAVREHPRKVIHVVRVVDDFLQPHELDEIAARMRERALQQGEQAATVVVVQGGPQESLRLLGEPYSVARVRAALFNAALPFSPIDLG